MSPAGAVWGITSGGAVACTGGEMVVEGRRDSAATASRCLWQRMVQALL